MSRSVSEGTVFRCPVCGAELVVLAGRTGEFDPRCCNCPMVAHRRRARFYVCPVCGAELVMVQPERGAFQPRCCNYPMEIRAAA